MEAFAYLDAGTGSIIIQALIGAVVAVGVVVKVYWGKLTNIFSKSDKATEQKSTEKLKAEKPKTTK